MDALLDDEAFLALFRPYLDPIFGSPSIPIECYLRLMFLKFRYRLGYESVCAEVADSISWRLFCRIGIDGKVARHTTLMKITTRCGSEVIEQLNQALLAKAAHATLLRVGKSAPTPPWCRATLSARPSWVCWPRRHPHRHQDGNTGRTPELPRESEES